MEDEKGGQKGLVAFLIAGIVLGALTSIRVIGPLAGLLVAGYLIQRSGIRHVGKLLFYGGVAAVTCYLTWPTLWGGPVRNLFDSLFLMARYERHEVLYRGATLLSTELPWHYLPWLLAIKLTLFAVILILVGVVITAWELIGRGDDPPMRALLPWLVLWVSVPTSLVLLGETPIYSNIRHAMFIVPPLFLLACAGLDWIVRLLAKGGLPQVLSSLVLIPGLVGIFSLHPYEYTYYNGLVGGVGGAQGRYELDYWCTSYREAMNLVNEVAGEQATVVAWGPERVARSFARRGILVQSTFEDTGAPDFILTCDQALLEDWFYSDIPVQHRISRLGAVYAEIKYAAND